MSDATYIRVSSDNQDVTRQRDSIGQWSTQQGWDITHQFEDSEGRNPRDQSAKRAGFQRMLEAVKAGLVKRIVVDSLDRFGTRDAYELGKFLTLLRDHGCQLWSVAQGHLTANDDATTLTNVLGAITSTREQKEKALRNIGGKIQKSKLGEYQGGYPPYGLDVVCFNDTSEKWRIHYVGHYKRFKIYPDGKREVFNGKNNSPAKDATDVLRYRPTIDQARLDVVRSIFEWFATEAISPGQIADRLNALDKSNTVATPWNKSIIRKMLSNPAYVGFPSWNKQAGSRFKEYVGGQIQDVVNTKGRKRSIVDHVKPSKQEYPPLVDSNTWDQVQAKLQATKQRTKRAPQVAELWLRGFLVCGRCNKPMRACGPQPRMEYGTYFCGTYGTYGKKNATGCRCHRVKHSTIEAMVDKYLAETGQEVGELVEVGADHFDDALCKWLETATERNRIWTRMNATAATPTSVENLFDIGSRYSPEDSEAITLEINAKEAELDAMLDGFARLTPAMQDRANAKMEAIAGEIESLRTTIEDLRIDYEGLSSELDARLATMNYAASLADETGPRRAEALSKVVDKIVCHFRYTKTKSFIDSVEIVAVDQAKSCFTIGTPPVPS